MMEKGWWKEYCAAEKFDKSGKKINKEFMVCALHGKKAGSYRQDPS